MRTSYFVWHLGLSTLFLLSCDGYSQSQPQTTSQELRKYLTSDDNAGDQNKDSQKRDWYYSGLEMNYVMLNALDLFTTFQSLDKGATEANPFARLFIDNKPLAIVVKGGVTAGVLFGLAQVRKEDKRAAVITLGLLNLMYGVVVTNNIGVYLQLN